MLTHLPPSNHASEDIHEQRNIDETRLESDISNIAHPDLIASRDLNVFKAIDPGTHTVNGLRGLTDTFDCDREIGGFHQSGNTFIPDSVSHTQQELRDTPISIFRVASR